MDRQLPPVDNPTLPHGVGPGLWRILRDQTFRSLHHRNYRLYFLGQIVSFTGSWMQSAALMWLVFDTTADPAWPPLMMACQVAPTLLLGTWGGTLADRLPKRNLIFATQTAFLMTAILLTAMVASDCTVPLLLLAIQIVNGIIQAIDLPARLSFVPDLVPRVDLINAVSLNSLLFNSARAIGPALSGGLFLLADAILEAGWLPGSRAVTLGAIWCFSLNVLSYIAVLAALRSIDIPGIPGENKVSNSIWEGFHYVLIRPLLASLLGLTGLLSIFGWPTLSLLPAYTKLALGHAEKEYSILVSALGAGALVGALTTATFGTVARRERFLIIGCLFGASGLFGLTLAETLPQAMTSAGCLGLGMILFLSTAQSAMQLSVPDEVRGRVMALWAMTLSASAPVGHLLAAKATEFWPIRDIMMAQSLGAALVAVAVLLMIVSRRSRSGAQ